MLPRELEAAVFVVVAAAALEHEAVAAAACRDASIGDKVGEKRAGSSIAQGQKKCDCFPLAFFFSTFSSRCFFFWCYFTRRLSALPLPLQSSIVGNSISIASSLPLSAFLTSSSVSPSATADSLAPRSRGRAAASAVVAPAAVPLCFLLLAATPSSAELTTAATPSSPIDAPTSWRTQSSRSDLETTPSPSESNTAKISRTLASRDARGENAARKPTNSLKFTDSKTLSRRFAKGLIESSGIDRNSSAEM